ncbi:MAG: ankyrin repeat domain-containing protein [Gallionella sp.]
MESPNEAKTELVLEAIRKRNQYKNQPDFYVQFCEQLNARNKYVNDADTMRIEFLFRAIQFQHEHVVDTLLSFPIDLESCQYGGMDVVHQAMVSHTNHRIIRKLLQKGANPDAIDTQGRTPLFYAVDRNDVELVKVLLESGADACKRDRFGQTPLHWSTHILNTFTNDGVCLNLLLNVVDTVNVIDNEGQTPLHCASRRGNPAQVQALIQAGADVNLQNRIGNTPAHELVQNLFPDFVSCVDSDEFKTLLLLIRAGADLDKEDRFGKTVYDLLKEADLTDFYELCLMESYRLDKEHLLDYADDFALEEIVLADNPPHRL